jgi:Uma2 family endonuclease
MSTAFTQSPHSTIQYPDDDGQPMSENTLQFKWIVLIKEGLETLFRHDPNVFVAGDLLWYPEEGKPKIRQAPDVMVVLGRPKGEHGSYKQWEEDDIAPQVVFEVVSPGNRFNELLRKFQFYEKYGVEEYYLYNPDNGDLLGWLRGDGGLEEVASMSGHVSRRLGIRFELGEGPNGLTIIGPDGQPLRTHQQLMEQAETERQRAETERQRAEAERQRAERLAARLRELGIEPD